MQPATRTILIGGTLSAALAVPVLAAAPATMDVTVTIPQLKVAEYHKPYVAFWVEKAGAPAKTVAVWYDHDMKANEGTKWLRDVRQWWRASGRSMTFPANGITGATRAPSRYTSTMPSAKYSCSGSPLMFWNGSTAIDGLSGSGSADRASGRDGPMR